jgi:hypothetical protein
VDIRFSVRGKTGRVSTEIHGGFFHVLKTEEQPKIRFRSREGLCLASLLYRGLGGAIVCGAWESHRKIIRAICDLNDFTKM